MAAHGDRQRRCTQEPLGAYDPVAIRSIKDRVDGDLYTSGSGTLVRAMLADGLVDALHLFVFPTTRGAGPRLFPGMQTGKVRPEPPDGRRRRVDHTGVAETGT